MGVTCCFERRRDVAGPWGSECRCWDEVELAMRCDTTSLWDGGVGRSGRREIRRAGNRGERRWIRKSGGTCKVCTYIQYVGSYVRDNTSYGTSYIPMRVDDVWKWSEFWALG